MLEFAPSMKGLLNQRKVNIKIC